MLLPVWVPLSKASFGPFHVPSFAASIVWTVVNDSERAERVRVELYRLVPGDERVLIESASKTFTLRPGESFVESEGTVTLPSFLSWHEVIVSSSGPHVLPSVEITLVFPTTPFLIAAGDFVELGGGPRR